MFMKNKIAIGVAVGILGAVGVITSAQAVHVNPDGTGQVLLFPYYNARDGYVTNVNLVNSTDQTKAVKIRFREGKTSNDVLDFNIYMSPNDVWTGSVKAGVDKAGKPIGAVSTADRSCTLPALVNCSNGECGGKPQPFTGPNLYPNVTADDTREGYVEVIEMGVVDDATVKAGVLHKNGTPTNCQAVADAWSTKKGGVFTKGQGISAPTGGLFGSSAILNVAEGSAFSVDPVAIDNYSTKAQHYRADDVNNFLLPSLASGDVTSSSVMVTKPTGETEMVVTDWKSGAEVGDACLKDGDSLTPACGTNPYPVAHALLAPHLLNEYFLDPSFGYDGHTDWVVTFPMKKHGIANAGSDVIASFENGIFDREEGSQASSGGGTSGSTSDEEFGFSPPVGGTNPVDTSSSLIREVNVISFKSTDPSYNDSRTILSSASKQSVSVGPFVTGWARLSFAGYSLKDGFKSAKGYSASPGTYTADSNVYKGVPATGAAFIEGNVSENAHSLFGDALPHKIQRD